MGAARAMLTGAAGLLAGRRAGRRRPRASAPTPPAPPRWTRGIAALEVDVDRRLHGWARDGARGRAAPPPLGRDERREALDQLARLADAMSPEQGEAVRRALQADEVAVRRLGPGDGTVWTVPGLRIYAVEGVQTFSVPEPGSAPGDAAGRGISG